MQKQVKQLFFLFSWLYSIVSFAQTAKTDTLRLSLQEATDLALQNSLAVMNSKLDITNARHVNKQYRAAGLPQVNASIGYQRFLALPKSLVPAEFFGGPPGTFAELEFGTKNNIPVGLDVSQLIFSGQYFVALEATQKLVEQSEMEVKINEQQVKNTVRDLYHGIVVIDENKRNLQDNIKLLQQTLYETDALNKAGFVELLDVERLQLSILNLNSTQDILDKQKENLLLAMKMLIGLDFNQPIALKEQLSDFIDANTTLDFDDLSPTRRLELKRLNIAEQLNELDIRQIKQQYYPTAAAFLSYKNTFQSNKLNIFDGQSWLSQALVGVSVNIPIFDGFSKKYQLQQRYITRQKLKNTQSILNRSLYLEIEQAQLAYKNATQQLQMQQKTTDMAKKIYKTVETKYKAGIGSSFELIEAQKEIYQNQSLYLSALYNLLVAKTNLAKALGQ
ncbi:MAG: TolC family protein [Chitinophagales bacterium]|nr:TolC family protein [Chitinophagales bacterium]